MDERSEGAGRQPAPGMRSRSELRGKARSRRMPMAGSASERASADRPGPWVAAQIAGVALTGLLLVALFVRPALALDLLWNMTIPLLPAVFLVSPALWRNVCPLATLNMLPGRRSRGRVLTSDLAPVLGIAAPLLLVTLVPARRFLFNTDGPALAVTILAVATAALLMGLVFDRKAGFCNAFCPVLPVERLYGQNPMVKVGNPRCHPCSLCTSPGCPDLSPKKSLTSAVGPEWSSEGWIRSPFGVFAAAFPGFVVGYYATADVPLAAAGSVYLQVAAWSVVSYAAVYLLVRSLRLPAATVFPGLAASAAGLYYWFAAPVITDAWGITGLLTWCIRLAALALVGLWFWQSPAGRSMASLARSDGSVRVR